MEAELLYGTLDLLILRVLRGGESHGYGIVTEIRRRTDDELVVEEAALYRALHRLEGRGLLESEWGLSENNRRAKFYGLTSRGRRALGERVESWRRYVDLVARVLEPA